MSRQPSPGPDGLAVQAGAFLTLSQCVWLRAWCDALLVHCSSRTSATSLGTEQRPRGQEGSPRVTQQVVYSQTWNPDPRTLHPGLFCLLTIPRKCQVVLGNIAPLLSEGRLRQSPWLHCGQAEMKPTPSDPECAHTLSPLGHPR